MDGGLGFVWGDCFEEGCFGGFVGGKVRKFGLEMERKGRYSSLRVISLAELFPFLMNSSEKGGEEGVESIGFV